MPAQVQQDAAQVVVVCAQVVDLPEEGLGAEAEAVDEDHGARGVDGPGPVVVDPDAAGVDVALPVEVVEAGCASQGAELPPVQGQPSPGG